MINKIPNLTLDSKAEISNENLVSSLKNNLFRINKIKNEDRRDILNNNEDHLNKKETQNYNENQLNIKPFTLSEDEDEEEVEDGHKKDMNNNKNQSQKTTDSYGEYQIKSETRLNENENGEEMVQNNDKNDSEKICENNNVQTKQMKSEFSEKYIYEDEFKKEKNRRKIRR